MAKKTSSKIFGKYEILTSPALNQKFEDMGPVNGLQPYNSNHVMDESMTLPIGSKSTPFGDVFCKGLNVYTQAEVLALVTAGKLTSSDRMLFIDPSTADLYLWTGTQIKQVGGDNMDYLFGDGSDGDVTLVANANYDVPKQFTNFTLNSGVTLSITNNATPLIIRCTGTCTINGTINLDGKGFIHPDSSTEGADGINNSIYGAGGGSGGTNNSESAGGRGGYSAQCHEGGSVNAHSLYMQLLSLNLDISCGGSGGNAGSMQNNNKGLGGSGGGALLIIAKSFKGSGTITAKGEDGVFYSGRYCGGGGGGGQVGVITSDNTFSGTITTTGGQVSSTAGGGIKPQAGGDGAYAILKI